jgi:hypothetical protein
VKKKRKKKMTKQSFGPTWHRATMQRKRWNGWEKQIKTELKADNPSNVPQAWPIENLWALLARVVLKDRKQKMRLNFALESKGSWNKLSLESSRRWWEAFAQSYAK